jgi:hypothetical protein
MQRFLLCAALAVVSISARAEDAIAIRYLDGHPTLDRSSEWLTLRISRHPPAVAQRSKRDIDRLFEQVSAVLAEHEVAKDWQLAIPDAPWIEITTEINGQRLKLISCHTLLEQSGNYLVTERGGEIVDPKDRSAVLAKQSVTFRQHRLAFERILKLALERTRARLSP